MNDDFNKILAISRILSKHKPLIVEVEDNVEGNMLFTFELGYDPSSTRCYTNYSVQDKYNATLSIVNASPTGTTHPAEPILLGTYAYNNLLYVMYYLQQEMEDGNRGISISFYTKPKD